jgi:hypothetical protein
MPAPTYTAIIRWRGPDPTLELETTHPGFGSPEEAALYANGIPPQTPSFLHLESDGTAVLVLNDDTETACAAELLSAWALPPDCPVTDGLIIADDEDFELLPRGELVLRYAAHGDYIQAQYGILDPNGSPLDVRVDWDNSNRLRVTIFENPPHRQQAGQACAFGMLPDA